ncbi:unnamed protein product [Rotaria sp. Silwood2]|nr:unnamed protein product [Rotaria sp. Silwood2]CAF2773362.1 unnamed protein product [Rotaria sp. Silwood2]CAF2845698.1 unnamed protein product [Rotaria sp. Silwood2]CAF3327180.1 unnamed protein product [Rotaria sp. Silwood2]CAF3914556.1 unnamed protein product [Rotaria sp. Silwood2]
MTRWEVERQDGGITDVMRVNILSIIGTSIDTHGTSQMFKIADEVRGWLDATYGNTWGVAIGETSKYECAFIPYGGKFLRLKETKLGWTIKIYQQCPNQ